MELEQRVCAGGCGRSFKVMPKSPITHARKNCEVICKGRPMTEDELKAMKREGLWSPPAPQRKPPAFMESDGHRSTWDYCVIKAREQVAVMKQARIKIAGLALQACTIPKAGAERAVAHRDGVYTLSRFADDIGVKRQTLYRWVRVKVLVIDKLTSTGNDAIDAEIEGAGFDEDDYYAAERTMVALGADGVKDSNVVRISFDQIKKGMAGGRRTVQNIERFIKLAHFLERRALTLNTDEVPETDLLQWAEGLEIALKAIRDKLALKTPLGKRA